MAEKVHKVNKKLLLAQALFVGFHAATNLTTYFVNKSMPNENTIVFTSGSDDKIPLPYEVNAKIIDFFMYTQVTLRQNLHGNKVIWMSNSNKKEVLNGLSNLQYQNIVFIGHGTGYSFWTADGPIYPEDISSSKIRKKSGELIQHTCGMGSPELRNSLLTFPEKGYYFEGPITAKQNYLTAWKELFKSF